MYFLVGQHLCVHRSPYGNRVVEFVLTSPTVHIITCSSYVDGLWDGRQLALQNLEVTLFNEYFTDSIPRRKMEPIQLVNGLLKETINVIKFLCIYIYVYLGSISSLMQISLNIIDILCLHILFWIRSNSRITFIVFGGNWFRYCL